MVASLNPAAASGLQIAPVTLTLLATQNADGIWLSNAGENVLNAQFGFFTGARALTATNFPPLRGWSLARRCWH